MVGIPRCGIPAPLPPQPRCGCSPRLKPRRASLPAQKGRELLQHSSPSGDRTPEGSSHARTKVLTRFEQSSNQTYARVHPPAGAGGLLARESKERQACRSLPGPHHQHPTTCDRHLNIKLLMLRHSSEAALLRAAPLLYPKINIFYSSVTVRLPLRYPKIII